MAAITGILPPPSVLDQTYRTGRVAVFGISTPLGVVPRPTTDVVIPVKPQATVHPRAF